VSRNRLLEHNPVDTLVSELLADACALSRHQYGRHTIVAVCEHGSPHQQGEVARAISAQDAAALACHRGGSYVVEAAIRTRGKAATGLKWTLVEESGRLAGSPTGCHALAAILETSQGDVHSAMARALSAQRDTLRLSLAGQRVEEALY